MTMAFLCPCAYMQTSLQVHRIDLDTTEGFGVSFTTFGATLLSVRSGDKDGTVEEVIIHFLFAGILFCYYCAVLPWERMSVSSKPDGTMGLAARDHGTGDRGDNKVLFAKWVQARPPPPFGHVRRRMRSTVLQIACPLASISMCT